MTRCSSFRSVVALLTAIFAGGCELVKDDFAVSSGTALYVTFKKTPSAQLLVLKNLLCGGDGGCVLNLMKQFAPTYCIVKIPNPFGDDYCIGQAEYNEILDTKHAGDIAAAITAVQSVNTPAACVRVKFWKSLGWGRIYNNAEWYPTNENCHDGGNLWD